MAAMRRTATAPWNLAEFGIAKTRVVASVVLAAQAAAGRASAEAAVSGP